MCRAYFFHEPTGRSQWESPSDGGPPPESDSYYRGPGPIPGPGISPGPGPGPSPGPYGPGYGYGGDGPSPAPREDPEMRKKDDKKKYLAAGAAGLALGAAGGAFIAHEMGMLILFFCSDLVGVVLTGYR